MNLDPQTRRVFAIVGGVAVALLAISLIFSGRPGDAIYSGPPIVAESAEATGEEVEGAEIAADGREAEAEVVTEDDVAAAAAVEEEAADTAAAAPEAPAEETAAAEAPAEETAAAEAEAPAGETAAEEPAAPAEETAAAEAPAEAEAAPADGEAVAEEAAPAEAEAAPTEVALAGDPDAGAQTFRQCQACHQIGDGAQNRVGPYLTGVIDRPAGSAEGFRYSAAMQAEAGEGLVWTPENLSAYLANPRGFVPGTSMAFAGLRNEADIANVIAYLASYE